MRVFVYGSLKKGFYNHGCLANSRFIANARTTPDYLLYSNGAYPMLVEAKNGPCIAGELFEVSDQDFERIERMETGAGYVRKLVTLTTEVIGDVYTYVYQRDVSHFIDAGDEWKHPACEVCGKENGRLSYVGGDAIEGGNENDDIKACDDCYEECEMKRIDREENEERD